MPVYADVLNIISIVNYTATPFCVDLSGETGDAFSKIFINICIYEQM